MEETRYCTLCHAELSEDEDYEVEGQQLCESCFEEHTTTCDHCGETIWASDSICDDRTTLCTCCYDDHYRRCEGCGRILHDDDVLWYHDMPYCANCYDRLDTEIEEYGYKPEPIFYGDGTRFFGVELEVDFGGKDEDNARRIKAQANTRCENIYVKSDGSLDDGFEIVTHPMTLDYHLHDMYWADILQEAVHLGYAHEGIIDKETFMRAQELLKAKKEYFLPDKPTTVTYPFSGMIHCGCCGKFYRRKVQPYRITWICWTYNARGKKYCPTSKQIPEDILYEKVCEVLQLDDFDDEIFQTEIEDILVPEANVLTFIFMDGHEQTVHWEDHSRSEAWTAEKRSQAAACGKKGAAARERRRKK